MSAEAVLHQEDARDNLYSNATTDGIAATSPWVQLCKDFLRCHRSPLNVTLHLLTTPLGWFGLVALLNSLSSITSACVVAFYVIFVALHVPTKTALATGVVMCGLLAASLWLQPVWWIGIVCIVVGYVGQESAHWLTGEQTLQSTYMKEQTWLNQFVQHAVLLLPVLLVTSGRRRQSPFRLFVARCAVIGTKLGSQQQMSDMQKIRQWVDEQPLPLVQSTHWWQSDLSSESADSFDRLANDATLKSMIRRYHGPGYEVKPVYGMNELYVTGPPKNSTSDTVFYMGHVDGPWAVFPGARLYRCMLAASENKQVTTHFPMIGARYDEPIGYRLEDGDAVAFDFNRELHYITRDGGSEQTGPRVNLKLHFVAYPKSIPFYGRLLERLTTTYDIRARNLFLKTIKPDSVAQKLKVKWVLGWTKIFECAVRFSGWANLAYVSVLALVAWIMGDYRPFLAGTSFVHYFIYIGTYRETEKVAFGEFLRNAIFFKALALIQLFALYVHALYLSGLNATNFSANHVSLAIVAGGFGLATLASHAIGLRRTYFSSELGLDTFERVNSFPFNVVRHPMVLGSMAGIAGTLLVPGMREHYAWLVVSHLLLYAIVLGQEVISAPREHS